MRSRYTAYAQNNEAYLLESWHPSTRPRSLDLASNMKWIRLKIVNSSESSVEFVATCRIDGKAHNLHEVSRFVFEAGRWYYVDGEIDE
jgi:SEC-C motif-containing protein